jgi:subtilisin-like proprotein convertase family protein
MNSRFLSLLSLGLLLTACAEDGKDGTNGINGTDGTDGVDGADGAAGADGTNGEDGLCADATPVEITGLTGLPTEAVTAFYPTEAITVESNAPGDLTYTVAGYGFDYEWDGDSFTVTPTTDAPSSQVIVATDGCTTATWEFELEAEIGTSLVNVIHLYDGAPLVDVTLSGDDLDDAILTDFGLGTETGYLPLDSMPYTFDVWAGGTVAATLPTIEPQPDGVYSVVVYSNGGAPAAMVIEDDLSEVATADAARVTATHVADGVGQVDIWETVLGAALFENLDYEATSASTDIVTGTYTVGIDATDDAVTDYDFQSIDLTGLEGLPINAYAYLWNGNPLLFISIPSVGAYANVLPDPLPAPSTTATASGATGASIDSLDTLYESITVTDACMVLDISVDVDITHTYATDVDMWLWAPDGTRVELQTDVRGTTSFFYDIIGTYEMDGTGSLSAEGDLTEFVGASGTGEWTLEIYDDASGDEGTLNSWGIELGCL